MITRALIGSVLSLSLLTGCAWLQEPSGYVLEPLPPESLPAAPRIVVERPELQIHQLQYRKSLDPAEVVKAYVATVQQLIQYSEALEKVIQELQQEHSENPE